MDVQAGRSRMMFESRAGCVDACVFLIAGCHSTAARPPTAAQLAGSRWTALLIDEGNVRRSAPTLEFLDEVKIGGYAGCNNYFGKVHVSGRSMRFINMGGTLVGCEDEVQNQEQRFMDALR